MAIGELLPRDFVEVKSQFFPATRIPVARVPAWRDCRAHVSTAIVAAAVAM